MSDGWGLKGGEEEGEWVASKEKLKYWRFICFYDILIDVEVQIVNCKLIKANGLFKLMNLMSSPGSLN